MPKTRAAIIRREPAAGIRMSKARSENQIENAIIPQMVKE